MSNCISVIAVARDDRGAVTSVLLGFEEIEVMFRRGNGRLQEVSRVFYGKGSCHDRWIPRDLYLQFIRTAWGVFADAPVPKK